MIISTKDGPPLKRSYEEANPKLNAFLWENWDILESAECKKYFQLGVGLYIGNFLCFYANALIRIILKENFPDEILLW